MPIPEYDVLIAGGSFAGLAVARALWEDGCRGDRPGAPTGLLLDRKPIGEGQTSACAAPIDLVRRMGAAGSILQEHGHLVFHTPEGSEHWVLPEPFCTFDYRRFCLDALEGLDIEVKILPVVGLQGREVITPRGRFRARFLVDCTGWRAVLRSTPSEEGGRGGRPVAPTQVHFSDTHHDSGRWMAFGLETEIPYKMPSGLHFYFLPEVPRGYAWAFPCGETVRFGILNYGIGAALSEAKGRPPKAPHQLPRRILEQFLIRFGLKPGQVHGGFLQGGLHPPVQDDIFAAGDAAGQCLPLSGEGIRTAVQAGWVCGTLLREVLAGRLDVEAAKAVYSGFVARQRLRYAVLGWIEALVGFLPPRAIGLLLRASRWPVLQQAFMHHYFSLFQVGGSLPKASSGMQGLAASELRAKDEEDPLHARR